MRRFQFVRFLVAGGLSIPVNLLSRILFSQWIPYELAIVFAHGCGMLTAYALTRLFVFEPSGRPGHVEIARFAVVNLVSVTITWVVAVGLVGHVFPALGFDHEAELVGHVAGLAVSSISSFYGHRHYSFRRRPGQT